jgi:ketosteroid isomerase-like protein
MKGTILAKFTTEQAVTVVAVQQLINDWGFDLDIHNGANIANLVTEDCSYMGRGVPMQGRAAVVKFYKDRLEQLAATPAGVPVHRHTLSNLRVTFKTADEVSITFSLVYYTTAGMASGTNHADPAAVADVRMNCRRDADGEWRIAMFDSNQSFKRVIA